MMLCNTRYCFDCRLWPDVLSLLLLAPLYTEPCNPSPCGPYSQCRVVNGQAVCSCVPGYVGSPPACRPECVVNSDCGRNEACSNQKCRDPCPGTCGVGARCEVVNHNPICSCPPRYTGDPFTRCRPIRKRFVRVCKFDASAIGLISGVNLRLCDVFFSSFRS